MWLLVLTYQLTALYWSLPESMPECTWLLLSANSWLLASA